MRKDQKKSAARRIDLSNCKLLAPYGRNGADSLKVGTKVGEIVKIGGMVKPGIMPKPGTVR
jgi:hypothetical protein